MLIEKEKRGAHHEVKRTYLKHSIEASPLAAKLTLVGRQESEKQKENDEKIEYI